MVGGHIVDNDVHQIVFGCACGRGSYTLLTRRQRLVDERSVVGCLDARYMSAGPFG